MSIPIVRWPDLRRSVFAPLVGAVLVLFLALALAGLWNEKRSETARLDRQVDTAARLFELRLAGDVETMRVAMEPMRGDPAILDPFVAGDRDMLLDAVRDRFANLHATHGISHMYFVGPDRVTLLRAHQPGRHGDVIERFTVRETQRTGTSTHGLELGPLGTLTLRVVVPLTREGRVIGYFELGREVEHYAEGIRQTLGVSLDVLVRKDLLVREEWAKGQKMLGRDVDWERFDEFVATGSSDAGEEIGEVFDEAVTSLSRSAAKPERLALVNGRRLAIGARTLWDSSGEDVGLLVVSLDATSSTIAFRRTLLVFLVVFLVFAVAMVVLLQRVVERAERSLRRAELVADEARAQLETRVRERTLELEIQITERENTEAQLRQAQKMEVIGQLTGGVAHDFNNLLAIIMGDLEYLRSKLADDELEELVDGAWEATERGANLVARLLAVSRKQPLSPCTVDANQLLEELVPLLERAIPREVELRAEYAPELWPCFVDPASLENLILNLVVNARDAMPKGGTVTIETGNRRVEMDEAESLAIKPGDYVELTVTDTGTGMSREVLERVFDPFFTTKDVGKGSGLGLSMVQGTAKQSGGHVEIESALGVGTTVRLLLPRIAPE